MKRMILSIFLVLCLMPFLYAQEADRQEAKYFPASGTLQLKTTAGEIFGLTMIASSNGGWIAIYDRSSNSGLTASTEPKIEIQEATANNTGKKDWSEGLNFYNGIYMEGSNVKAIIYYR